MNKVEKTDDMFDKLLDMNLVQADNTVNFTEESKKLIKEIADKCRQTELYKRMQRQEWEIAKLSAQEMYLHIINKCKTQTRIIVKAAVRTFIPMLDDKLELENKGEKKVE